MQLLIWNKELNFYLILMNKQAIEYYSQSLAIEEKTYGDDNLILCATLSSIAILCQQIGSYHDVMA